MRRRLGAALVAAVAVFSLAGCAETFTFEAVPVGVDDDDAEEGLEGDPTRFDCFTIEADHSGGDDDDDQQLGTFCKTDDGERADEDEQDD